MPIDYSSVDGYIDDYRTHIHREKHDSFLNNPWHACKELRKALDLLPRNLAEPGHDWGLLRSLYFQKEMAHEKAEKEAKALPFYMDILNREVERCENNLHALKRDHRNIKMPGNKNAYDESINTYGEQLRKATEQRRLTAELQVAMNAALRESKARQFATDYDMAMSKSGSANKHQPHHGKPVKTQTAGSSAPQHGHERSQK